MGVSRTLSVIKARNFIADFKGLCSSRAEVLAAFEKVGLSSCVFTNWQHRMGDDDTLRVNDEVFRTLCEVSGLSYNDYFIKSTTYRKNPKTNGKPSAKVHSHKMKNGVRVTTYIKTEDTPSNATAIESAAANVAGELLEAIIDFKRHMEVYRKLLGVSTADLVDDYGVENYAEIVSGKDSLSLSKYVLISAIFMEKFNSMTDGPLKVAFEDLATKYNDIYIQSIFFGNTEKRKKGGR